MRKTKKAQEAAAVADCKRRGLWPFPERGVVKPMSERAMKRDAMRELAALGKAIF